MIASSSFRLFGVDLVEFYAKLLLLDTSCIGK
jgi:hypothetical protein